MKRTTPDHFSKDTDENETPRIDHGGIVRSVCDSFASTDCRRPAIGNVAGNDGKLILAGATKAAIKSLPEFEYAKLITVPKARKDYVHH